MICNAYVDQCIMYSHHVQASTDDVTRIVGVLKKFEEDPDGVAHLERESADHGVAPQASGRLELVPYQPPRVGTVRSEDQIVPWRAQTTEPRR